MTLSIASVCLTYNNANVSSYHCWICPPHYFYFVHYVTEYVHTYLPYTYHIYCVMYIVLWMICKILCNIRYTTCTCLSNCKWSWFVEVWLPLDPWTWWTHAMCLLLRPSMEGSTTLFHMFPLILILWFIFIVDGSLSKMEWMAILKNYWWWEYKNIFFGSC